MLSSVLLILPLAALYLILQRRRRRAVERMAGPGLVQAVAPGGRLRRHLPTFFFLCGLVILLASLARPQAVVSLPRMQGTVILAFDVSGSMAADDFKPTRMEAAKAAADDFIQRQPRNVRIGVVAFSESGIAVQPPTDDRDALLAAVKRLEPERGTSLANGILAALNVIALDEAGVQTNYYSSRVPTPTPAATPTALPQGVYSPAVIVLLTDGENTVSPDPLAAADAAARRGVRIYTVGIGSPAGASLKVEGFTVHTQLDEAALKEIAGRTDGVYYNAATQEDLHSIYDNLQPHLLVKPEKTEITSLFAGAGLLVLLVGAALSLMWLSRLP